MDAKVSTLPFEVVSVIERCDRTGHHPSGFETHYAAGDLSWLFFKDADGYWRWTRFLRHDPAVCMQSSKGFRSKIECINDAKHKGFGAVKKRPR